MPDKEEQRIDATDAAVELAALNDMDLSTIEGSGEEGRIIKADVETALAALEAAEAAEKEAAAPPTEEPQAEETTEEEPVAEEKNVRVPQPRLAGTGGFSVKNNIIKS